MNQIIRIAHIITTLEQGGAENMLYKIAGEIATDARYQQIVISLTGLGVFGPLLVQKGVRVYHVDMRLKCADILKLMVLIKIIREFRPQILQTWLYHADLLGTFVARFAGGAKLIWNVRCSDMALQKYAWTTKLVFGFLQRLSRIPSVVCANSRAGILAHKKKGYHPIRWVWIPNGFDTERYKPQPRNSKLRTDLGIPLNAAIIGMVARFDPMKDFATFFQAAEIALKKCRDIHFVIVGNQISFENLSLCRLVEKHQLTPNVHLLGRRNDVETIYPEMDIFTLTSFGEGFPNVIAEAMACGVPCVATDVGDIKLIIGNTGLTVPAKDPHGLASAWHCLLNASAEKKAQLGQAARRRIVDKYRMDLIKNKYLSLYDSLILRG
jgi:glycosyltransferase involved in cell wall biosynthesis